MIDTDELDLEQMRLLRKECDVRQAQTNFDQICRIVITGFAMILDSAIKKKTKNASPR